MTQNTTSKTAVLVNFERFDPTLTAAVVLAKAIARIDKSPVHLLWNDHVPAKLDAWVSLQNVELQKYTPQSHPMITLQNINAQVSELKWVQKDNKLEIEILTTSNSEMKPSQIAIQAHTLPYSTIYLLGNFEMQQIVQALGVADAASLDNVKLVNVSKSKSEKRLTGESFVYEAATFAEVVYRFLTTRGIEVSSTELTELLQSVYGATNLLRSHKVDAGTLENVRGLLEAGATHPLAVRRAANTLDLETSKLWATALNSVEVSSMQIAVAKLEQPISLAQLNSLRAATVASPLQFLSSVKASFWLAPIDGGGTWVCASSNLRELNLRSIFGEYDLTGDSIQAQFVTDSSVDETWDLINKQLNKELSSKPINPPKPSSEPSQQSKPNPFTNFAANRQPERPAQKSIASQGPSHSPEKAALGPKITFPTKSFEKPATVKLPPETHMPKVDLEESDSQPLAIVKSPEKPIEPKKPLQSRWQEDVADVESATSTNIRGLMAVGEMGDDLDTPGSQEIDPLAPISDEELNQLISSNGDVATDNPDTLSNEADPLPAAA